MTALRSLLLALLTLALVSCTDDPSTSNNAAADEPGEEPDTTGSSNGPAMDGGPNAPDMDGGLGGSGNGNQGEDGATVDPAVDAADPGVAPPVQKPLSVRPAQAQFISVPPNFALGGEDYSYVPRTTLSGEVEWKVADGPLDAMGGDAVSIKDGNRVEFSPTVADGDKDGKVTFTVVGTSKKGTGEEVVVRQEVEVDVATTKQRAKKSMSPATASQVVVTAPASKVKGAGINMPAGALSEEREITIAEVDKAPKFPNQKSTPKVVDFGPSGTTFKKSATIALPFDNTPQAGETAEQMAARILGAIGAFTYNLDLGRWESVPVVNVDVAAGILYARASHFSIYAAAEVDLDYELRVEALDAGSICEGRLAARGELGDGLGDLDLDSVNSLSEAMSALGAANVAELVAHSGFAGSLRFVRVYTLTSASGTTSTKVQVSTLNATADGSTLVHTDAFGNVIADLSFEDHRTDLATVSEHLSGKAVHTFFDEGFGSGEFTIAGRLHVVYSEADQSLVGGGDEGLGLAAIDVATGDLGTADTTVDGFDVDCDGYRGGFDTFDNSLEPKLVATPDEAITVMLGTDVQLSASAQDFNDPPTETRWSFIVGGETATLGTVEDDPSARSLSASEPGFYTVLVAVDVDDDTLEHRFNVQVLPLPMVNTPPTCVPTALSDIAEEGETVTVFAVADDEQTPTEALELEWGLAFDGGSGLQLVSTAAIAGQGPVVGFTSAAAGTFSIGCRAHDGEIWGPIATTDVGVVPAASNLAPVDFLVSPPAAQIVVGDTATFTASASDPDGDQLTFAWVHPFGAGVPNDGATLTTLDSLGEGSYSLVASVSDGIAPAQYLPVALTVLPAPVQVDDVDADDDGFPCGADPDDPMGVCLLDCDDGDAAINRDQEEICGNNIDENCDGEIATDDCDGDGYASVDADGTDCDDTNPDIHPGAHEYCDGIDNNCSAFGDDDGIDETYSLGTTCLAGLGVCTNTGMLSCAPDRVNTVCAAQPLPSSPEICDGVDNDCDDLKDEDDVCTTDKVGVYFACALQDGNEDCSVLSGDGFELQPEGGFRNVKGADGEDIFDPAGLFCTAEEGTWTASGDTVTVIMDIDGISVSMDVEFQVQQTPDLVQLYYMDAETGAPQLEMYRRVRGVYGGEPCPEDVLCGPGGCCSCDSGPGCQSNCSCDPECDGGGCTCNTSSACDSGCEHCDPDCGGIDCGCDTSSACDSGCEHCDRDCDFGCSSSGSEQCDGIDNDCNGIVDDVLCDTGLPGICDKGLDLCDGMGCVPHIAPDSQVDYCLDGLDNDCDGTIDDQDCTQPPAGMGCFNPIDLGLGGSRATSLVDGADNVTSPCFSGSLLDHVYSFTVPTGGADVYFHLRADGPAVCDRDGVDNNGDTVVDEPDEPCNVAPAAGEAAGSVSGSGLTMTVLRDLCDPSYYVSCYADSSPDEWFDEGQYFVVVESPFPVPYTLSLATRPNDGQCSVSDADQDGYTLCDGDCAEGDPAVHSGAREVCGDGLDNDCSGVVDDLDAFCSVAGTFGQCAMGKASCDDNGAEICEQQYFPTSEDYCQDGVDNDCDGEVDEEGCLTLAAGEACFNAVDITALGTFGASLNGALDNGRGDCDDPAAPDQWFTFTVSESATYFINVAQLNSPEPVCGCDVDPMGCDDGCHCDPDCNPCNDDDDNDGILNCEDPCPGNPDTSCTGGAGEPALDGGTGSPVAGHSGVSWALHEGTCGQLDQWSCQGPGYTDSWFLDPGTYTIVVESWVPADFEVNIARLDEQTDECTPPDMDADGYTMCNGDCREFNGTVAPGQIEICDGMDNDCNGVVDDLYLGCTVPNVMGQCAQGMAACDDQNIQFCQQTQFPDEEWCGDGKDNDCDGETDEAGCTPVPAGDRCDFAVDASAGGEFTGDLASVGSASEFSSCGRYDSPEQFWRIDVPFNGKLNFAVEAAGGDIWATLLQGNCGSLSEWNCQYFGPGAGPLPEPWDVSPGTYFVVVEGEPDLYQLTVVLYDQDTGTCHPGDLDGDGYTACEGDCNESDANINEAASEICNSFDDNCNGIVDEGCPCEDDGLDNDADGVTDESGELCAVDPCAIDSDQDGAVDCQDPCPTDPTNNCAGTGPHCPDMANQAQCESYSECYWDGQLQRCEFAGATVDCSTYDGDPTGCSAAGCFFDKGTCVTGPAGCSTYQGDETGCNSAGCVFDSGTGDCFDAPQGPDCAMYTGDIEGCTSWVECEWDFQTGNCFLAPPAT